MFYIRLLSEFCKSNAIDDAKRDEGLTTPVDIERFDNIRYGEHERNILDVYRPKDQKGKLPLIVSIHGGGWVYGSKEINQFYCMSLAERGFAVVNFSYRLAPEFKHPGTFVFLSEIKGLYRICSNVESRSRGINHDFFEKKFAADSAGFEEAVKLAKQYGTMGGMSDDDIRIGFYVRSALSMLHGNSEEYCKKALVLAMNNSKQKTMEYIDRLYCDPEDKERMNLIASTIEA